MEPEIIQRILEEKFSGAEVTVMDMTGTRDHFEVVVFWEGFKGKNLVQQHKMVNEVLSPQLEDGSIHALKLKTLCPK